jgi:VWFA-related protein
MDLDVSVTDSKGNPVTDLTKDDFRVTVDGKPVPIDYFARVAEGTIHAPDLASASPDRILAEYRKADESYIPREFLMYVDIGNLSPNNRKRGLEALRDLVTRMGPSDRGRVVLFDRRAKPQTEWTASKGSSSRLFRGWRERASACRACSRRLRPSIRSTRPGSARPASSSPAPTPRRRASRSRTC